MGVGRLPKRALWILKAGFSTNGWRHSPDLLSAHELARVLDIPVNWIYVQIRQGRLLIDRHPSGAHQFANTRKVIEAVRKLRNHKVDRVDLRINQPHQEGH